MKINAGCGGRYLPGYTNIDIQAAPGRPPPDIVCDLRTVPLRDGCAEEILAIHVFEHFYKWEVAALLAEWHRLLAPTGVLVLELPNLIKCCRAVLDLHESKVLPTAGKDPEQLGMWGLFGDPRGEDPYMCHRWSWSPDTLMACLRVNGFKHSEERETQWHPVGRRYRDMRIEARKA